MTVKVLMIAEFEIDPPGQSGPILDRYAQDVIDAFRESCHPYDEYGISLHRAPASTVKVVNEFEEDEEGNRTGEIYL